MTQAVRISRVRGGMAASQPQVRITRVYGAGSGVGQVRISRVRGAVKGFLIGTAGDVTTDPFQTMTLAAFLLPGSPVADTWDWQQLSGPPVTLVGTGPTRTYTAPVSLVKIARTFQVTATLAGFADATAPPVTHTIRGHGGLWRADAATLSWVGVNFVPAGSPFGAGPFGLGSFGG